MNLVVSLIFPELKFCKSSTAERAAASVMLVRCGSSSNFQNAFVFRDTVVCFGASTTQKCRNQQHEKRHIHVVFKCIDSATLSSQFGFGLIGLVELVLTLTYQI